MLRRIGGHGLRVHNILPTLLPKRSIALLSTSDILGAKHLQLPPRPKVAEDEFTEVFLKGSGPGGQKINKTSSAVQLHHNATGIVVKSQATRSRIQNRKIARQILAEKLEEREVLERRGGEQEEEGKEERKGTGAVEKTRKELKADFARKKKASADKKKKRKYRALEEEKKQQQQQQQEQNDEGERQE